MSMEAFYDNDARKKMIEGADILYEAMKRTMGAKGRDAIIRKKDGSIIVTHDGATVAKEFEYDDTELNNGVAAGFDLMRYLSINLNNQVHEGSTSVVVLGRNILFEEDKLIAAGFDPAYLSENIKDASNEALTHLEDMVEHIDQESRKIADAATISTHGDAKLGNLVADVVKKVGNEGIIVVEVGQGMETEPEIVEGYTFDRGYVSPYMVTDPHKMEAVYHNPAVVVTDKKISNFQEIMNLFERAVLKGKREFVIIADNAEGDTIANILLNRKDNVFNAVVVKAPSFGPNRTNVLEDIATLLGTKVISEEKGMTFDDIEVDELGSAQRIVVTRDTTTIFKGAGDANKIAELIASINDQAERTKNEFERDNLKARSAALSGKVAVIRVGGISEAEINRNKDRIDDSVAAARWALSEGIVAGGGVTLINIAEKLDESKGPGYKLLKKVLEMPFRIILENAGLNPDEWLPQIRSKVGIGINLENPSKVMDMKKNGVVDPVHVTREVIKHAVSTANTLTTAGSLIVPRKTKDEASQTGQML